MMRALLAALVLVWASTAAQAAGKPVVRAAIEGKQPVLVGQTVRVFVDVLVPNYFMSGVTIGAVDLPGAVVSVPDSSTQHLQETIGGEEYVGIRQSFTVVAQREGTFQLPPAKITFKYAADAGKATNVSMTLPPAKFSAKLPAGAKVAGGGAVPVAKVTISQSLDRDTAGLKAGDALTRTVETSAGKTQAMMIPPPEFPAPAGVRVYRKDPVLTDAKDGRGAFLGGKRVDRVTYVFDKPGDYALPAVEVGWFNAAANRRETAVAPAIKLSVAENPDQKPAIAPDAAPAVAAAAQPLPWKRWLAWAGVASLALLAINLFVRFLAPRLHRWRATRHEAYEQSEAAYFARVERACGANDAASVYGAFLAWRRRTERAADSPELRREVAQLETVLYAAGERAGWTGAGFAAALSGARRDHRIRRDTGCDPALPALNPTN